MDDLLTEVRKTNQLLSLAHGPAIGERLRNLGSSAANRVVLAVLEGGDLAATEALVDAGRRAGVGRTTIFGALSELERFGVIERPRRGQVALSRAAAPFLPRMTAPAAQDQQGAVRDAGA